MQPTRANFRQMPLSVLCCLGEALPRPVAAVLLLLAASCSSIDRDGLPVIRKSNFWNYYERGLALAMRKRWEQAALHFQIAMGDAGKAVETDSVDRWRAKTYGLHFLDDYFPHRELGICYYFQKQYDKAEIELQHSLSQTPSSRASHYINEVRKAQLAQQGVRRQPGTIRFDVVEPSENSVVTNRPEIPVQARILSPYRVNTVTLNGRRALVETAVENYTLTERLALAPGTNRISVAATDLAGNEDTWTRTVALDLSGPSVAIGFPNADQTAVLVVVTDDDALAEVSIQGQTVPLTNGTARVEHRVPIQDTSRVEVRCRDRAGNETRVERPVRDLLGACPGPARRQEFLVASADPHLTRRLLAQADDSPSPEDDPLPDTMPPIIEMRHPANPRAVTAERIFTLKIDMTDRGAGIDRILVTTADGEEGARPSQKGAASWTYDRPLQLALGDNPVTIDAYDLRGNRRTVELNIRRVKGIRLGRDYRMSVHLMECASDDDLAQHLKRRSIQPTPLILGDLLREPRRLNVIERDPDVLAALMTEHGIATSELSRDVPANIRVRRFKVAEWLLHPAASSWAGDSDWQLTLEAVDADGTKPLFVDIHLNSFDLEHVLERIEDLGNKLRQALPSVTGEVMNAPAAAATVALPENHNVREGMWFLFQAEHSAESHACTPLEVTFKERILFFPVDRTAWLQGQVTSVEPYGCTLRLYPEGQGGVLKKGALAITR